MKTNFTIGLMAGLMLGLTGMACGESAYTGRRAPEPREEEHESETKAPSEESGDSPDSTKEYPEYLVERYVDRTYGVVCYKSFVGGFSCVKVDLPKKSKRGKMRKFKKDLIEPGFYIKEEGETVEEAIDAHAESIKSLKHAIELALHNVSKGSKWEVIDETGKVHASGIRESE